MNVYELETFELNLELYDHNALLPNELLGQYSIGLSTLYRNLSHEIYKVWVGVLFKEDTNKITGYILLSCFIIGPNEKPPVHSQDEDFGNDDGLEADSDEDEDDIARRIESIKRAQGVMQVSTPAKIEKNFQMAVVVAKYADLVAIKDGTMPFVSARVNGAVLVTNAKRGAKGQFNAKLQYPIFYPILNNKITMRVWSKTGMVKANKFLANIPEHPGPFDQFNLTKLLSQDGRMKARWFNLYGTHPDERSDKTKRMTEGTSYLGRVLIAFNIVSADRPVLQVQQGMPINDPKSMAYKLWVDLYELLDCELIKPDDPISVRCSIGAQTTNKIAMDYK